MNPLFLMIPLVALQTPGAPISDIDAKDLPAAPRGPMVPERRDLGAEQGITGAVRRGARGGPSIPALQLPAGNVRVKDKIPDMSGWRAYAIEVPGGGSVKAHVVEGRKAWFRVLGVNEWGRDEPGLLQNRLYRGEPLATYKNPHAEARIVYFIVDTQDANMVGEPFTLEVTRG